MRCKRRPFCDRIRTISMVPHTYAAGGGFPGAIQQPPAPCMHPACIAQRAHVQLAGCAARTDRPAICMSVSPTGRAGEREDVRTDASSLINSTSEQRVKYSANGHSSTTLRSTRLPQRHRPPRNIGHRGRCCCAYAAGTHQLPVIRVHNRS